MSRPIIYLAGAIRDNNEYDIQWREQFIERLVHKSDIINPLGGKVFDKYTRQWTVSGIPSGPKVIVNHDFWSVDRADIIIFNFTALAEKYPNIGTLVEFGLATSTGALIYCIVDETYEGHENRGMNYGLHPFLAEPSAVIFYSVSSCIDFCDKHIPVLMGDTPSYRG